MNDKGILLFDIDRTIFDTTRLSGLFESGLEKVIKNVSSEEVKKAKNDYSSSLSDKIEFDPENLAKFLCEKLGFDDKDKILELYYGPKYKYWYKDSVFPESYQVFEKIKNKYRLGVYSEGTKRFQNYKFKSMELDKYIENDLVFIFDHKTNSEALSKIPKEAIIVDDKESVCEYLTDNGFRAIWLNKKDDRKSDRFQTIHNLLDLPEILL